jgi:hypothetical protein
MVTLLVSYLSACLCIYLLACLLTCLVAYLRTWSFGPLVLWFCCCRFIVGTMLWHYFTCTNCHRAKKSCDRTEDSPCSRCTLYSKKCCVRKPRGWVGKKVKTKDDGNVSFWGATKPKTNNGKKSAVKPKPKSKSKLKSKAKPKSKPKSKSKLKVKPKVKPQDDLGEQKTVASVSNDILDFMPARDVKPLSPPPDVIVPEIEPMSAGERAYANYCDALDLDIIRMLPTSMRATSVDMELLDLVFGLGL